MVQRSGDPPLVGGVDLEHTSVSQNAVPFAQRLLQLRRGDVLDHVDGEHLVRPSVRDRKAMTGAKQVEVGRGSIDVDVDVTRPRSPAGSDLDPPGAPRRDVETVVLPDPRSEEAQPPAVRVPVAGGPDRGPERDSADPDTALERPDGGFHEPREER